MTQKKAAHEIFNPHAFSKEVYAVFESIVHENGEDKGTALLAERIAHAIETFRGGATRPYQPLYTALLFGDTLGGTHFEAAPMRRLVEALARSWLGELPDGQAPYTLIPCSQFRGTNPYPAIRELLRGAKKTNGGFELSILSRQALARPHQIAVAGHELIPLEAWHAKMQQSVFPQIMAIRKEVNIEKEIAAFEQLLTSSYNDIYKRYGPFHSVILFENIDQASEIFFAEVLLPILRTGMLQIAPDDIADFSHSIILMTAQDIDGIIPRSSHFGFATQDKPTKSRLDQFLQVRQKLLQARMREVVAEIGDELVIIGPRSRHAQYMQLKNELEVIRRRLENHGVIVIFEPQFREWLLEQARERLRGARNQADGNVWTDVALEDAIDRNVRRALAHVVNEGRLVRGATIVFRVNEELARQNSRDALELEVPQVPDAAQEILDAAFLRTALSGEGARTYQMTEAIQSLQAAIIMIMQSAQQKAEQNPTIPPDMQNEAVQPVQHEEQTQNEDENQDE